MVWAFFFVRIGLAGFVINFLCKKGAIFDFLDVRYLETGSDPQ